MNVNEFRVLTVRFNNHTKNCFASLPNSWNLRGKQDVIVLEVEDSSTKVKCQLTWAGHRNSKDELTLNGLFGSRLGLVDGNEVIVKVSSSYASPCIEAEVTPISSDDWDVMECNVRFVESGLIHQIRCIWSGMVFPIWTSGNICLFVRVLSVNPDLCPVLLQEHTHITVLAPNAQNAARANSFAGSSQNERSPQRNPRTKRDVTRSSSVNQILSAFSSVMNALSPSSPQTQVDSPSFDQNRRDNEVLKELSVAIDLRVLSLQELLGDRTSEVALIPPTTVFVHENTFGSVGQELPTSFLCYMRKLLSPGEKMSLHKGQNDSTKTISYRTESEVVRVIVGRDFGKHPLPWKLKNLLPGSVAIHDLLRRQLGLEVTAKVWIQSISHRAESSQCNVVLHPLVLQLSQSEERLIDAFRLWMSALRMPLATSGEGSLVHFPKDGGTDLVLKVEAPPEGKPPTAYWILGGGQGLGVRLGPKATPQHTAWGPSLPCKLEALVQKYKPAGPKLRELGGVKPVADLVLEWLELNLRLSPLSQGVFAGSGAGVPCLLLCGPKGVGKTALCQAICQRVSSWKGHVVHTLIMPCRNLRGKRVESLCKIWQGELSECVYRQPSLLVLDDLDLIASAPTGPEAEAGLDSLYFSRIAQTLISLQDLLQESQVVLMATGKSVQSLHPKLSDGRGRHFFSKVVTLKPPDVDQRKEILSSLIKTKDHLAEESLANVSLDSLSAKTDGYVAQDLQMLVDRATHAAFLNEVDGVASQLVLRDESFQTALQDFVPSSLCGLSLHSDLSRTWQDLGGLADVKQALLQTLVWPLKYPKLFGSSALRMQSGVLLYGAPGTGKTLLAGILATEAGLNFISIKGPELLSKYIGASEQAVRDLFQRAQSAKPCVLFFDEFDAIVPRRGHDSTGVTDRVVNQFLTQMDGVESLTGVYVLSASSRPDLIDPALLRPGRIDKCLYCPLPQEREREEILQCLSRGLYLDSGVDLGDLARLTPSFSGADLQALLYSAQLIALQDFQRNRATSVSRSDSQTVLMSTEDVVYMPNLLEGPQALDDLKDAEAIMQQVERVSQNSQRTGHKSAFVSCRQSRKSSVVHPAIAQSHLLQALEESKGSVVNRDLDKFHTIYAEFRRSREGDSVPPTTPRMATLA